MKNVLFAVVLGCAMLLYSAASFAQETAVSLGLKGWYNSWEEKNKDVAESVESENSVLLIGPNLKIGKDRLFAGASLLFSLSDYEFDFGLSSDVEVSRKDFDLVAGYMFHPRFGVMGGYKHISGDFTFEATDLFELKVSGPAVGLTANLPLENTPVVLLGSLSYLILTSEYEYDDGTSEEFDAKGTTIEIGAAYGISDRVSASIGYKRQSFEDDDEETEDIFSGLTFGADYRF